MLKKYQALGVRKRGGHVLNTEAPSKPPAVLIREWRDEEKNNEGPFQRAPKEVRHTAASHSQVQSQTGNSLFRLEDHQQENSCEVGGPKAAGVHKMSMVCPQSLNKRHPQQRMHEADRKSVV